METLNVTQKPQPISIAVNLLWASLVIGLIKVLLDFSYINALIPAATIYSTFSFTFIILAFLTWKISSGKNWARIVLLVLFITGLFPGLTFFISELSRSPLIGTLSVAQSCLQGYAMFLTFTKPGKIWFSKRVSA